MGSCVGGSIPWPYNISNLSLLLSLEPSEKFAVVVGGGRWWWLRVMLVLSFGLRQAEQ